MEARRNLYPEQDRTLKIAKAKTKAPANLGEKNSRLGETEGPRSRSTLQPKMDKHQSRDTLKFAKVYEVYHSASWLSQPKKGGVIPRRS